MQAQLLLGPAGSGKTRRCLEEVRAELARDPGGPPLLFLTPKQATFQIERQLLADFRVPGFTRLRILSFDRLAEDLIEDSGFPLRVLSQEGRGMVLRALLARHQGELEVFRASARLPGFARQLGLTLRELRRHQLHPRLLRRKAETQDAESGLAGKLRDCARLLEAYDDWLHSRDLEDDDVILDQATALVGKWSSPGSPSGDAERHPRLMQHLWLDGFAEMTPQEIDLVSALLPHCSSATLAFCLPSLRETQPGGFQPWAVVGRTCGTLLARIERIPSVQLTVLELNPDPGRSRFRDSPVLASLERAWATGRVPDSNHETSDASPSNPRVHSRQPHLPSPLSELRSLNSDLRLRICPHPEAEAVLAAREILDHVQRGGRFREAAILLRSIESHHAVLDRVLRRYGIPFFMDRRESVAHHPLAELTRYSLSTLAFGWRHEDWFGALKSGLLPAGVEDVDWLENEALAHGWEGPRWQQPLAIKDRDAGAVLERLEPVRRRVIAPMAQLSSDLFGTEAMSELVSGGQLAQALIRFWEALDVPGQLERWATLEKGRDREAGRHAAVHRSLWEQMLEWAENLALAFEQDALALRDWIPIVETGLAELTIGVIPPALDQVLVGAVDRSRNPDVQLVVLPGLNEGVFPARPAAPGLFSDADRRRLESAGLQLGPDFRTQLAQERYYAYIAFTRSSRRVVASWSERDQDGRPLIPSPWISQLKRWMPGLEPESFSGTPEIETALHPCELASTYLARRRVGDAEDTARWTSLMDLAGDWRVRLDALAGYHPGDRLSPAVATELYGPVLRSSASALEQFAACPFRFFVAAGLKAEERPRFALDAREQGSFQHEVLATFHQQLAQEQRRWRDLTPEEARVRIRAAAAVIEEQFREGLLRAAPGHRFTARCLTAALEDFIEITVGWMTSYRFDPVAVEVGFGLADSPLPAWTIDLGEGRRLEFRGKIDRVDVASDPESAGPYILVADYKSGRRSLDQRLLEHGIQIQLPAYLAALCSIRATSAWLRLTHLIPAGVCYVNLRGQYDNGENRIDVLDGLADQRRAAYLHRGRFRLDVLSLLDANAPAGRSGQFHIRLKKSGQPVAGSQDLMDPEAFQKLLIRVEEQLREAGRRILAGEIRVDPYRNGAEKACDTCEFQGICRIDPWTHPFRILRSGEHEEADDPSAELNST